MELYKSLTFPHRGNIFETFLLEDAQFPNKIPPYSSSTFPEMTKQIISIVYCLLEYQSYQWVDEAIIGFLSVFSIGENPTIIFNYSDFLADVIHEKFLKFSTEGTFK